MMAIARSRVMVVVGSQETMNNCLGTLPQNRVVWPIAPVSLRPIQTSKLPKPHSLKGAESLIIIYLCTRKYAL